MPNLGIVLKLKNLGSWGCPYIKLRGKTRTEDQAEVLRLLTADCWLTTDDWLTDWRRNVVIITSASTRVRGSQNKLSCGQRRSTVFVGLFVGVIMYVITLSLLPVSLFYHHNTTTIALPCLRFGQYYNIRYVYKYMSCTNNAKFATWARDCRFINWLRTQKSGSPTFFEEKQETKS